jgi:hypothetical protein
MPDLHMLPGLWAIDGYGKLVNGLKARFTLSEANANQPGNLFLFPTTGVCRTSSRPASSPKRRRVN